MPTTSAIPGQLRDEEKLAIELIASLLPANGHMVEVGSLLGLSSWIWAKSADPSVTVHCVDPWELGGAGGNFNKLAGDNDQVFTRAQFLDNVKDCPNIRAHQGFSPVDFKSWTQKIDLYFEDAVHTNPVLAENIAFWCGLLNPDGIICGHDHIDRFPDVCDAAQALASSYQRDLLLIGSLWLLLPQSIVRSTDARVQTVTRRLTDLAATAKPGESVSRQQHSLALARTAGIPSFRYELTLDTAVEQAIAQRGEPMILKGRIRNISGCAWPVGLTPECYLEVGAELMADGRKVAAGRQTVLLPTVQPDDLISFALVLPAKVVGTVTCKIDLLYRHLFWFADRDATASMIPMTISLAGAARS
ncbi:class I SAM-dependent methyltransferase [Acidisphaera sp. L21]|uniref:class I SAM-dependent methyltransferase n=1 Tax=Acidisphaera sp. L21 TaxID=1641851 RepID=UPI00131E2C50|nr:class I SAM-dependent methyltransferase [Acidisphaera sp. L21]